MKWTTSLAAYFRNIIMIQQQCTQSPFKETSLTVRGRKKKKEKGHVPCLTKPQIPPSSTVNLKLVTDSLDHYQHTELLLLLLSHARNTLEHSGGASQCCAMPVICQSQRGLSSRWHLHRTSAQPPFLKQSCRKYLPKLNNPCSFPPQI